MYRARNVYLICSFAAIGKSPDRLGGVLFGFDISSMSGVLGTQAYKQYFGHPVSYTQGAITASMPAGSFFGSLLSSVLADRLSRKVALQISCVFWIVGSVIQCAAQNIPMLCAGRAVAGVCVGIVSSVVPIYQSEIAPKEIRGRVVSLQQWAITWGILIQYFIQYGVAESIGGGAHDQKQPNAAFRIPWGVQMVPAWVLLAGLFFCPYTPGWLASKDRWNEALLVLADLHGSGDIRHARVLAQYREIEDALRFERECADGSFAALVRRPMLKRVVLGMSIQAWSQLCGMNIMMYYIVYVMEGAQIGSPLLTASIQYIINVVFTLPAILFLDKWGRRPSLVIGSFLMMTWLFISGALQQYYGQPNTEETRTADNKDITWVVVGNRAASYGIVVCSYLFVATFATTWGPTSWTYPAEIFPSRIRAKGVSVSTATNWLFNMALAFAVPPLFIAAAFVHMYLAAHETKGYTLEEMDDVFDKGTRAWQKGAPRKSRLEQLETQIATGAAKVRAPAVREVPSTSAEASIWEAQAGGVLTPRRGPVLGEFAQTGTADR
ncbi:High-affinity glucose transporter [Tolypocladium ophioglossoides CBS 100239]|uniref:High-affinity glucose transporter n=1 Tax=Tolypocladium ophioglossoides (strain CBS 100239) TaxID=1163406 RepID=A0A0L0N9U5_TOLOC|nr:High-affinity glucose transporter [Tolypocladium ophioglossoides CBS 100239]